MNNASSYPRTKTLTARVLARLLLGEKMTHRTTDTVAGTYRLAGFINTLGDRHNWQIEREQFMSDTHDPTGRNAKYMSYWLSKGTIGDAGTEAQVYAEHVLVWEYGQIAQRVSEGIRPKQIDGEEESRKRIFEESINGPH
jgi:hypothetical protein